MKDWKGFMKGVNLGGWLSQCDYSEDRLNNFIKEEDIKKIAELGFDHVRVPVDYNILEDNKGGYIESGFEHIAFAVNTARKYGLNLLLDLHRTAGFMFDAGVNESGFFEEEALQERFYRLWEEFAKRFGSDPEHVAFELLNEVTDKEYSPIWNRIAKECIGRIRAIAPDVVILVGSYYNNSVGAVKDLDAPYDDKVVYNFHCYDPLLFTHQHAYWVDDPEIDKDRTFEESGIDEKYFEGLFAEAINKAQENDTLLYCGEYGVIDRVDPVEALKWYKCIGNTFRKFGIRHCVWSYKEMDFGIMDAHYDAVRDELLSYVL